MRPGIGAIAGCAGMFALVLVNVAQAKCIKISDCGCIPCPPDIETHTCAWVMGGRTCDSGDDEKRVGRNTPGSPGMKTPRMTPNKGR